MSQISCSDIINYYSTLKYLSFKVLHDHESQNYNLTHFRVAPIFGGLEKGVRVVQKIGRQNVCVLYILRGLQTINQNMSTKIEREYVSTCISGGAAGAPRWPREPPVGGYFQSTWAG